MIKSVIIEDDPITIKILTKLIEKRDDIELLKSFTNPEEALNQLNLIKPDLLFLDVEMPEMSGVELVKQLDYETNFVFVSAHPSYAIDGFNLNAVDFVTKPIEEKRFDQAIEKVKENLSGKFPAIKEDYFFLKDNNTYQKVPFEEIVMIKSDTDYLHIHTFDDRRYVLLHTLKTMQEKLRKYGFIKVHKSYIVNKTKISEIDREEGVLTVGQFEVPYSRRMKKSVYQALNIKK